MNEKDLELFDLLEELHMDILEIEEELEEKGYDLDEILVDIEDDLEKGFEGASRIKRLIAQRKAAMRRRLKTGGTQYKKK